MLGDRKTAILRGGAPWGLRLSGGSETPIYIAKVFFLSSLRLKTTDQLSFYIKSTLACYF